MMVLVLSCYVYGEDFLLMVFGIVRHLFSLIIRFPHIGSSLGCLDPWEHVLLMSIGVVAANGLANWEEKLQADVEKHREEDAEINKRRFKGTVRAVREE